MYRNKKNGIIGIIITIIILILVVIFSNGETEKFVPIILASIFLIILLYLNGTGRASRVCLYMYL